MSIKAAVIGHPIGHAKSPLIHQYWIKKYGLDGSYEAIDIPCENLKARVEGLVAEGYAGFNVTVPHKQAIFELCDEVDDLAKVVGAVNTVVIKDGKLSGSNTDVFGFVHNIKTNVPDFDFSAGQAVVLGAGGAARAVVQGLIDEDVPEILLLNRTAEKAQQLLESCSNPAAVNIGEWEERSMLLGDANLLVNTTSLGMTGAAALEIDLSHLPQGALVNDVVYAPLYTDLLTAARAWGNPVVSGIGMLLHQARPGFEKWFGVSPEIDIALEKLVLG